MKKLILVFVMWPMMVSVFGQNQRKSITDTVFQLDQAIVKETIKKKVNLLNLDVPLKTLPMTVTTLSSDGSYGERSVGSFLPLFGSGIE